MAVLKAGVSIASMVARIITAKPLRNPPLKTPKIPPNAAPLPARLKIQRGAPTSFPIESKNPNAKPINRPLTMYVVTPRD